MSDLLAVTERLKAHGIELLERKPELPEQIPLLIHRHAREVDLVIVGGGDGSMSAAAPALVETKLPLGVLPMGTANDLARTLSIPTDIVQAADVIGGGLMHRIDLGRVNGHLFFNVANIGLGVHVTHNLSPGLKQRWGALSYARSLLKAINTFRPFHANIVCDGRRLRVRTIQIAVGNGRYYGGGMTVAEQATIDDHLFYLYSVEPLSLWEMIRYAPSFKAGRFAQLDPVDLEKARTIEIITRRPMPITADGEIVTKTPARFEMLAAAVNVFVPEAYFGDRQEVLHAAQG